MVCGRFGHEHIGHVSLFEISMKLCKRTLILVGSAQESGTLRNPYRVETRIEVIRETFPGVPDNILMVRGLNDMTNEYDITDDWGRYVIGNVISHMHKFSDLMVYGNDEFRSKWFAPEDLIGTNELIVTRSTIPVSATQVRGMLVIDDETAWQKVTHPFIHGMYGRLRAELMQVPQYKEIYDRIRRLDLSMDNFMEVYKELEEKDKQQKLAELQK